MSRELTNMSVIIPISLTSAAVRQEFSQCLQETEVKSSAMENETDNISRRPDLFQKARTGVIRERVGTCL